MNMKQLFSKVFMWMFIGLFISFGCAFYVSTQPNMVYNIFSTGLYWVILISEFVLVLILGVRAHRMKGLTAKIMFCLYSLLTGLTFSILFVAYQLPSIVSIFGVTAVLFLIMSLLGQYTKLDFSKIGNVLFLGLIMIITISIVNLFIGNTLLYTVLNALGVLVFVLYTAYDIQMIKRLSESGIEQDNLAIIGALHLYIDFINLFLQLLRLFGKAKD